jgi:hypothetical protein
MFFRVEEHASADTIIGIDASPALWYSSATFNRCSGLTAGEFCSRFPIGYSYKQDPARRL